MSDYEHDDAQNNAGDGSYQWYERGVLGGVTGLFVSKEKRALRQRDQAEHEMAKADVKLEAAGLDTLSSETVAPIVPTGRGTAVATTAPKVKTMLRKLNALVEKQGEIIKAQAEDIDRLEEITRRLVKAEHKKAGMWDSGAGALLKYIEPMIGFLNAGDKVQNETALTGYFFADMFTSGMSPNMQKLVKVGLLALAYVDNRKGWMSVFSSDRRRSGLAGIIAPTTGAASGAVKASPGI